ncbi:nonstructural protein [Munia coronavirus HKU13-3514]|uniref:Nonstructural protein n=1 Tax=Munia coronavirus HKU13 TaxID=1297661 RepID=B6VDZ2_9NIDO|nr:nonstructural protein [Munia coronavirus HKU13-3514]ACJ12067.1 nonstructural protein [Munia coronavirus HKU13-3514]
MSRKFSKLTYPLGGSHETFVPHNCANHMEPCDIPTMTPYQPYIAESFKLILEEIAETGQSCSPHAVLHYHEQGLKVWKVHWQRGGDCGPGHCITVFQKQGINSIDWDSVDFTTHGVYTIPLPN